ncbi:cytochrome c3 family protein [bacterium]|nr:cytochrome c3 family protein [bacterium]
MSTKSYKWLALFLLLVFGAVQSVNAQVISPGDLILGHKPWDKIDSCISCHQLGKKGVEDTRCLSCHTPLRDQINLDVGLHATYDEPTCATCHKDHFGRDFDAIRFDTTSFDHTKTGYELLQSHTEVACTSCHDSGNLAAKGVVDFLKKHRSSNQTFLGLDDNCASCHTPDNVHERQFDGVACSTCHDQNVWEEAPIFNHDEANYTLTGEHRTVECASCHEPSSSNPEVVAYKPLKFTECSSCHEDEHKGSFGTTCTSCHSTKGWGTMVSASFEDTFDHNSTPFALVGLHKAAACESCHSPKARGLGLSIEFVRSTLGKSYPHPLAAECQTCHDDAHAGSILTAESNIESCATCHDENGWAPSDFDAFRHQDETEYPLEGAHLAVVCAQCHTSIADAQTSGTYGNITFAVENTACEGCHEPDNIHGDQFLPETCESCHNPSGWLEAETAFDHATTEFPLVGAHITTTCLSCHVAEDTEIAPFRNLDTACIACHQTDNPHETQFEDTTCETCHDSVSFLMASFDHNLTKWPLEGAHTTVQCASCHTSKLNAVGEPMVQYRGIGTACQDCHGGNIPDEK